jgi:hypothetical protein
MKTAFHEVATTRIRLLLLSLLPLALAAAPTQSDQAHHDLQEAVAEQGQEIEALRLTVHALALRHRLLSLKLELLGRSGPVVLESQLQEAARALERLAELDIDIAALGILKEEMVTLAERLREGNLAVARQSIDGMLEPLEAIIAMP